MATVLRPPTITRRPVLSTVAAVVSQAAVTGSLLGTLLAPTLPPGQQATDLPVRRLVQPLTWTQAPTVTALQTTLPFASGDWPLPARARRGTDLTWVQGPISPGLTIPVGVQTTALPPLRRARTITLYHWSQSPAVPPASIPVTPPVWTLPLRAAHPPFLYDAKPTTPQPTPSHLFRRTLQLRIGTRTEPEKL